MEVIPALLLERRCGMGDKGYRRACFGLAVEVGVGEQMEAFLSQHSTDTFIAHVWNSFSVSSMGKGVSECEWGE